VGDVTGPTKSDILKGGGTDTNLLTDFANSGFGLCADFTQHIAEVKQIVV